MHSSAITTHFWFCYLDMEVDHDSQREQFGAVGRPAEVPHPPDGRHLQVTNLLWLQKCCGTIIAPTNTYHGLKVQVGLGELLH